MNKLLTAFAIIGLLSVNIALAGTPSVYVAKSPDGRMTITLTSDKCQGKILALIPKQWHSKMQSATVQMDDRKLAACWSALSNGMVGIIDEDGDQGQIEANLFKPAEDV